MKASLFVLLCILLNLGFSKHVPPLEWEKCNSTSVCFYFEGCGLHDKAPLIFGMPNDTNCEEGVIIDSTSPDDWNFQIRVKGQGKGETITVNVGDTELVKFVKSERIFPESTCTYCGFLDNAQVFRDDSAAFIEIPWSTQDRSGAVHKSVTEYLKVSDMFKVKFTGEGLVEIPTKNITNVFDTKRVPCPDLMPRDCTKVDAYMSCDVITPAQMEKAVKGDEKLECKKGLRLFYASSGKWNHTRSVTCKDGNWETEGSKNIESGAEVFCGAHNCTSCDPPSDNRISTIIDQTTVDKCSVLTGCLDGYRTERGLTANVRCEFNQEQLKTEWVMQVHDGIKAVNYIKCEEKEEGGGAGGKVADHCTSAHPFFIFLFMLLIVICH